LGEVRLATEPQRHEEREEKRQGRPLHFVKLEIIAD